MHGLEPTEFALTINWRDLGAVIDDVESIAYQFSSKFDRNVFVVNHQQVDTVDDYLAVTIAIDVVPETALEIEDILGAVTRKELLSNALLAYEEQTRIRDLFRDVDVDSSRHQMEFDVRSTPGMVRELGDDLHTELDYQTKAVERMTIGGEFVVPQPASRYVPFTDAAKQWGEQFHDGALDALNPEEMVLGDDGDVHSTLLDGLDRLHCANYQPDTIVVGNERREEEVSKSTGRFMGHDVVVDPYLSPTEMYIGDSGHVGYECVWDEPTMRTQRRLIGPTNSENANPYDVRFKTARNWVGYSDDAVVKIELKSALESSGE